MSAEIDFDMPEGRKKEWSRELRELGPGDQVGPYVLGERIGEGGMGAVYRAQNVHVESMVRAVKVIRASFACEPDFRQRFLQEAEMMERLHHPHILRVETVGEAQGSLYMVTELLQGKPLVSLLEETAGGLPVAVAVAMMHQALAGVAHAHGHQIVHRDLKPANLFVTQDGVVKVLDFGIARHGGAAHLTHTGAGVPGTPAYYAPEFMEGRGSSPASDLYSLGVALFELLTGRLPYLPGGGSDAQAAMSLMMQHVSRPFPDVRELRPEVPEALVAVLARVCAKRPEERPPSADAFARELLAAVPEAAAFLERVPFACIVPTGAVTVDALSNTWTPADGAAAVAPVGGHVAAPGALGQPPSAISTAAMSRGSRPLASSLLSTAQEVLHPEQPIQLRRRAAPPTPWHRVAAMAALAVGLLGAGVWAVHEEPAHAGARARPAAPAAPVAAPKPAESRPVAVPAPAKPQSLKVVPSTMVLVPAGTLHQGRAPHGKGALDSPIHDVEIKPVLLERFEVTVYNYAVFVSQTGAFSPWGDLMDLSPIGKLPVTGMTEEDAEKYCAWRYPGGRLPTESEWEWAARGPRGNLYPWGSRFDPACTNGRGHLSHVQLGGQAVCGDTESGLHDMAGNVAEWTRSPTSLYPGANARIPVGSGAYVARGGSYQSARADELTATARAFPAGPNPATGFRCAAVWAP